MTPNNQQYPDLKKYITYDKKCGMYYFIVLWTIVFWSNQFSCLLVVDRILSTLLHWVVSTHQTASLTICNKGEGGRAGEEGGGGDGVCFKKGALSRIGSYFDTLRPWMTYRIKWKNIFVPIMKVGILHLNIITE